MDLRYTAEELAFRDELRGFIADNLPGDLRERMRLGHAPSKLVGPPDHGLVSLGKPPRARADAAY